MSTGCRASLAEGQWWNFCGETDMGQTLPVLCTKCGGDMVRADDPDATQKVEQAKIVWAAQSVQLDDERQRFAWKHPARWNQIDIPKAFKDASDTHEAATGWAPSFVVIKKAPTKAERLEDLLREYISPFDLKLNKEQTKVLEGMLKKASEHICRKFR